MTLFVTQLMYLNPIASNPSGHVISDVQKKEIYDLACEFNLLILEDDPYYFLSFQEVCSYAHTAVLLDKFACLYQTGR